MKYEIIKGSEKDFEGAPEWVTKLIVGERSANKSYVGTINGIVFISGVKEPFNAAEMNLCYLHSVIAERRPITDPVTGGAVIGKFVPIGDSSIHRKEFNVLTKEPSDYLAPAWKGKAEAGYDYHVTEKSWKFESHSWDGEGLPPVGALCRYRAFSDMPWVECKVLAWHDDEVWLKRTEDGITFTLGNPELFPICSPEDLARDEAALDLFLTINFNDTEADWVALGARRNDYYKAIDAGYRKME